MMGSTKLEQLGYEKEFNPRGLGLVRKWHEDQGHILTTNYYYNDGSQERDLEYPS